MDVIAGLARMLRHYIYLAGIKKEPRSFVEERMRIVFACLGATAALAALGSLSGNRVIMIVSPLPLVIGLVNLFSPYFAAMSHVRGLERELDVVASHLVIYSAVGKPPHEALYRVGEKSYLAPNTAKLVSRIKKMKLVKLVDDLDAIEEEARQIKSNVVQNMLYAIVGSERGGGGMYATFKDFMKSAFLELRERYKRLDDFMKFIGDVIIIFFGVLPMMIYVMFSLFASEQGIMQSLLFSLLVTPLVFLALVLIIDMVYPKGVVSYARFYRMLARTLPVGIAVGAAAYVVLGHVLAGHIGEFSKYVIPTALSLGIMAAFLPVGISYLRHAMYERAIDAALPQFVRDLTESVRRGKTPAIAIDEISRLRSYGRVFDGIVARMRSALRYGATLSEAIDAIRDKLSWRGKVVFELIKEADIAGARAEFFDEIAGVTREITDLMRLAKASSLPTRIFGIVTTAIVVSLIVMLSSQLLESIAEMASRMSVGLLGITGFGGFTNIRFITPETLPTISNIIVSGAVIAALALGLLTGKLSDGNLAAGILYSVFTVGLALAIIAVAAVIL